jgi:hypothetical protein
MTLPEAMKLLEAHPLEDMSEKDRNDVLAVVDKCLQVLKAFKHHFPYEHALFLEKNMDRSLAFAAEFADVASPDFLEQATGTRDSDRLKARITAKMFRRAGGPRVVKGDK